VANYSSVNRCWDMINTDVLDELRNGFVARVPFRPFKVNALGAVPKSDGRWRRITDLSKPKGAQLNSFGPEAVPFNFASIDDAVKFIIRNGNKVVIASKYDIRAAFRHVPIRPEFWHLLGFYWDGFYYVDLRMCFGLSIAPYVFWRISNYISRVAKRHYDVEANLPYIDDFLLLSEASTPSPLCWPRSAPTKALPAASRTWAGPSHRTRSSPHARTSCSLGSASTS
jgi:hypothetical protein